MNGAPMELPQWLTVDLGRNCAITSAVIDWETAYARQYEIKLSQASSSGYQTIFTELSGSAEGSPPKRDQHVLHALEIPPNKQSVKGRFVRLNLLQSGTQWGISVWRFDIYGHGA